MEKKQFKGWGVLAAAFILSFIPTAIMSNCFSLYMAPVCSDLGFSNTSWSMVNLISSFASAIASPWVPDCAGLSPLSAPQSGSFIFSSASPTYSWPV